MSDIRKSLFDQLNTPDTWEEYKRRWSGCQECVRLADGRSKVVHEVLIPCAPTAIHKIHPSNDMAARLESGLPPEVLVVAQAPGKGEDKAGLPFQGKPGKLAIEWLTTRPGGLRAPGWNLAMTNTIACVPPRSEFGITWESKWMRNCHDRLEQVISLINPRMIIVLGAIAATRFGIRGKIDDIRGSRINYKGAELVVCTFPAQILRGQNTNERKILEERVREDMQIARDVYIHVSKADGKAKKERESWEP